jgi:RecJ-like exonuclease
MYTTDPHLEGVSNNESGAVQLVQSAGIELKDENGDFRSLADLSEPEERKLIQEMIQSGFEVQQLLNDVYMLPNGYEIDEFSTVINACGRLGRPRDGVKILLENDLDLANTISRKYGRKISSSLSFVEDNKNDESKIYENSIGVIDAGSEIGEDFIGTVTTITMSNGVFSAPVVVGIAEAEKDKLKVSSRASKEVVENGLNLGEVVSDACESCDGEGGGHNIAAGAKIPGEQKDAFLEELESSISNAVS